jgi:hypothetical protein
VIAVMERKAVHGGGGVERLGGRAEPHPGLVQVVEQRDQVTQAAGEPVTR